MNRFKMRITMLKKLKVKNPDESWDFIFVGNTAEIMS